MVVKGVFGQSVVREISPRTRANILDGLRIDSVHWWGTLDDVAFLGRIFDLEDMPSTDGRYPNAAGDIWQHTVNNDDWPHDWVYSDRRFNLPSCPDQQFIDFLSETLHPVVRPQHQDALKLVKHFNEQLRKDGWELVEVESIAGRPRYEGRRVSSNQGSMTQARRVADALDAGWMHREIIRAEQAIENDLDLAIGTAKELVETCCKTLLEKLGEEVPSKSKYPGLVRRTVKAIKLTREDIPEESKGLETIRNLLSNLTSITQSLNELRNLYGTGHGRQGGHKGLQPRHARLAVTAAVAFVVFVADTYRDRLSH